MNAPTQKFLKENQAYAVALFFFALIFLYHNWIVPATKTPKSKVTESVAKIEEPALDNKNREKIYERVLQSQRGDIFRIGAVFKVTQAQRVHVFLRSAFEPRVKVGEFLIEPTLDGKYSELVFVTGGQYQDVVFELDESLRPNGPGWKDSSVIIRSFFLTRLENLTADQVSDLSPTVFGLSQRSKRNFHLKEGQEESGARIWRFETSQDFVDTVSFSGSWSTGSLTEYTFSLYEYDSERKKRGPEIRSTSFFLHELSAYQIPSGDYILPLPAPLKRGGWYELALEPRAMQDPKHLTLRPLNSEEQTERTDNRAYISLSLGTFTSLKDGQILLDYARLEDLGSTFLYSFSLTGRETDYLNLAHASAGVKYDHKKNLVVGKKQEGEHFTYKIDTLYPFARLSLHAEQAKESSGSVRLEYSWDNSFWREIPYFQQSGEVQKYDFLLEGRKGVSTVYLRASYAGEEKKTGTFALEKVSVTAVVPKTQ